MASSSTSGRIKNPVLFICDLQEKFRPAIYKFPNVLNTAQKLLEAADHLNIPVVATTQTRAKLGNTCSELGIDKFASTIADVDKTAFSMWVPDVVSVLSNLSEKSTPADIIIVGIETHICVLQTTLDALANGHRVWVVQDGVSSINPEERVVALNRLRQEGARITTSESVIYEFLGDAKSEAFSSIFKLVKKSGPETKQSLETLCRI